MRLCFSLLVLVSATSQAPAAVALVVDGAPKAVIVLPDRPSPMVALAARVLRDHVKQSSGAELPIRPEAEAAPASADHPWVLIGEGRQSRALGLSMEKLGPGGVLLRAKGHAVALLGSDSATDPGGTLHAVTTFLEEKMGVRYLWPGELGKVVPKRKTIAIDEFEERFAPALAQRQIRNLGYNNRLQAGLDRLGFTKAEWEAAMARGQKTDAESLGWYRWQRLGGTLRFSGGHAFDNYWARFGKDHPDWFARQPDGTRDQKLSPGRPRLCKSNLELIEAVAKDKIEELTKNPALLGVSIAPSDGGATSFCSCPKCEALDDPRGRKMTILETVEGTRRQVEHVALTDRMVYFWNAIAERVVKVHPDKFLVVDAYSVYASPPVARTLHPNLVVRFASLGYDTVKTRGDGLEDWAGWSKSAKRIYMRSNLMLAGRRNGLPTIYVHKFAEDFRRFSREGMLGTDFDSCTNNWATQGLNYYVVARLHWDPAQDVNAIIDDYCKAGFGPAAATVKTFFEREEELYDHCSKREDESRAGSVAAYSPTAVPELRTLLARARKEAGADPDVLKRLEFLDVGLRWTDLELQALRLLYAPAPVDKAAAKTLLDERHALMRDLFGKWPLAVNVAYIAYGEGGAWSALGWRPPK